MNTRNVLLSALTLLTIVFASLTVYEYNQVGNLSAQLQSRTQTRQCIRTGQGYAFYVRVVADGTNTSISGAKVNAISYTTCASGYTEWGSPITTTTPENGTIALPVSAIGGFKIIIMYLGGGFFVWDVFFSPVPGTTATLSIPSTEVTVQYPPTHTHHFFFMALSFFV